MARILIGIISILYMVSYANSEDASFSPNILMPELANTIIAQGRVETVDEKDNVFESTIEITHVYHGSKQWEGSTFQALSLKPGGQDWNGSYLNPALELGETAIWSLEKRDNVLISVQVRPFDIRWPVRKKTNERYPEVKTLAETIERVVDAVPDLRRDMLESLSLSQIPEISSWSIRTLADIEADDSVLFFHQLISEDKLSLAGKVALDEVLSGLDPIAWRDSDQRRDFIGKWLQGPINEYEARSALSRLDAIIQGNKYDNMIVLEVLKAGAKNKSLSNNLKGEIIRQIGFTATCGKNESTKSFTALIDMIDSEEDPGIQLSAAYAIRNFVNLDPKDADKLNNSRSRLKNKKVKDVLSQILDSEPGQ